jgi:tetratricopeptide (TPR) repeat protein
MGGAWRTSVASVRRSTSTRAASRSIPDNAWLYRHRGHRYISVRELDRAIADLERATVLTQGRADEIEPDGQPNARNTPIGTLQSNIAYHLGLAHYLKGDFGRAIGVYRRELAKAGNDDRRVSTAHWLYMSLRRSGRDDDAAEVLVPIRRSMNVIENETYHRLLLLYKGELPVDSVLSRRARPARCPSPTPPARTASATGTSTTDDAPKPSACSGGSWPAGQWGAFGYIAAEAEIARLKR